MLLGGHWEQCLHCVWLSNLEGNCLPPTPSPNNPHNRYAFTLHLSRVLLKLPSSSATDVINLFILSRGREKVSETWIPRNIYWLDFQNVTLCLWLRNSRSIESNTLLFIMVKAYYTKKHLKFHQHTSSSPPWNSIGMFSHYNQDSAGVNWHAKQIIFIFNSIADASSSFMHTHNQIIRQNVLKTVTTK